jgi:hypothetical protein
VKDQLERDGKVIDLMTAMENVYSFVDEIQSIPDKVKSLDKVIKTILQQTFECAIFIQEYAGLGFASLFSVFPMSSMFDWHILQRKHWSRHFQMVPPIVAKFTESFIQLKSNLDSGIFMQTALVSSRTYDRVETIGSRTCGPIDQSYRWHAPIQSQTANLVNLATGSHETVWPFRVSSRDSGRCPEFCHRLGDKWFSGPECPLASRCCGIGEELPVNDTG